VTFFSRPLPESPEHSGTRLRRTRSLLAATLALAVIALGAFASSAGAVVSNVGGTTVGVQPRIGTEYIKNLSPTTYANNSGHPVLHGQGTFAIYWDPTDHYHGDWQRFIDKFFNDAGASSGALDSVFSVITQYTDTSNTPAIYEQKFKGAYTDTKAYPASGCVDPSPFENVDLIGPGHTPVCLTSAQVAAEVESFVSRNSLPTGMGATYYLLTPPGVAVCLDGGGAAGHCSDYEEGSEESYENSFCSYHSAINPTLPSGGPGTLLYAVIPWTAGGFGDPLLTVKDQLPGWECQDGGLDPTSKPHPYEKEEAKEKSKEEEEKFEEATKEGKEEILEQERAEGPHAEEPNQLSCPTVFDGGCDTGLFDLQVNQIGIEQVNMITNPLLNAWQDSKGNENTDECRFLFGPVTGGSVTASTESVAGTLSNETLNGTPYYINNAFNKAADELPWPGAPCMSHINLDPSFSAPNPVNAGEIVGFNGMESNITLNAATAFDSKGSPTQNYATYKWEFGDGTAAVTGFAPGAPACESPWLSPCAAAVFHAYQYGGTYNVTLTVTDTGKHVAATARTVTVVGPPPPASGTGSASASGSATGSGAGGAGAGAGAGAGGAGAAAKAPVATAVVLTRSLKSALKRGMLISYSVDQQITGHMEVMLGRSVARRLGIKAPAATSLAAGTSPRVVVAKAFIRTTKGGRSKITLKFTSKTAKKLAHQQRLPLALRLFVRNSANQPATVLTSFTLSH
jgi:hypothetical protein